MNYDWIWVSIIILVALVTWREAYRCGRLAERIYLRENPEQLHEELEEEDPYYD